MIDEEPKTELRKCESCNAMAQCTYEADPFMSEIHGDNSEVWQCEKCYENSCDDI